MTIRIKKLEINISKCFTYLIVLYPILSVYFVKFCGISLSLPDVLLLILFPFLLFDFFLQRFILLDKLTIMFFIYVFLHFLLIANSSEVFVDTAHFLLVLFVIAFFCPNFFDKELGVKLIIVFSVISSIYLIIQFFMIHFAEIYLPGQFSILTVYTAQTGRIRPFSFFSEPAAFGTYNSIGLGIVLFSNNIPLNKKNVYLIIISTALFLVTSTTALGLMIIVWATWINKRKGRIFKYIVAFLIVFVPIIFMFNLRFGIVNKIMQHSISGLLKGNYADGLIGRTGGLRYAFSFNKNASIIQKLFGSGMINLSRVANGHYLPTLGRINVFYGISGYIVVFLYFLKQYLLSNECARSLLILAIVSMFFSESVFGLTMLWYMPYVIAWKSKYSQIEEGI